MKSASPLDPRWNCSPVLEKKTEKGAAGTRGNRLTPDVDAGMDVEKPAVDARRQGAGDGHARCSRNSGHACWVRWRLVDELHARAELPQLVALLPGVRRLVLELLLQDAGQGHSGNGDTSSRCDDAGGWPSTRRRRMRTRRRRMWRRRHRYQMRGRRRLAVEAKASDTDATTPDTEATTPDVPAVDTATLEADAEMPETPASIS